MWNANALAAVPHSFVITRSWLLTTKLHRAPSTEPLLVLLQVLFHPFLPRLSSSIIRTPLLSTYVIPQSSTDVRFSSLLLLLLLLLLVSLLHSARTYTNTPCLLSAVPLHIVPGSFAIPRFVIWTRIRTGIVPRPES